VAKDISLPNLRSDNDGKKAIFHLTHLTNFMYSTHVMSIRKNIAARCRKAVLACLATGICAVSPPGPAAAEIYMHIDDQGLYHFTDTPRSAHYIPARYFQGPKMTALHANRYEGLIQSIAKTHGVRPELVQAVIHVESGFNPAAVSGSGARGLMQIMPVHIRQHRVSDPFDPGQNIMAGTRYLSSLLKRYNGDLNLSLAAYNAGPGAVARYRGIPPYRETRQYVQKVLSLYRQYRNIQK
jgi:hypothetical protein